MNKIILLILPLFILAACKNKPEEEKKTQKFCLTDLMDRNVETSKCIKSAVYCDLKLSAKVTFDEEKVVKVYPFTNGIIKELKVSVGDFVNKGDILAVIRSSEMSQLENDNIAANSNLSIAQKNYEAVQDMFQDGLASEKDFIIAKNELNKAKSELQKTNEILALYGSNEPTLYNLKAPISGYVIEKNVTENMQFRGDGNVDLFTISNLDDVWIMANVYETDISKVKVGLETNISLMAYPDDIFKGKIDKVYEFLDPVSKVMKARIALDNKQMFLKPEMFAIVNLSYPLNETLPTVPVKALIFDKSKYFVMIYNGKCDIETREVEVFKTNSNWAYISRGVKEGEKVIVRNQLFIYDELND